MNQRQHLSCGKELTNKGNLAIYMYDEGLQVKKLT